MERVRIRRIEELCTIEERYEYARKYIEASGINDELESAMYQILARPPYKRPRAEHLAKAVGEILAGKSAGEAKGGVPSPNDTDGNEDDERYQKVGEYVAFSGIHRRIEKEIRSVLGQSIRPDPSKLCAFIGNKLIAPESASEVSTSDILRRASLMSLGFPVAFPTVEGIPSERTE